MKNRIDFRQFKTVFRKSFVPSLFMMGLVATAQAQELQQPEPIFWFGASAAGNINYFTGTTQVLNSSVKAPAAFHDGSGVGPYASILLEYRPKPILGLMLNLGYDSHGGHFDQIKSPCNCPEDLKTPLSYLTIEPSLRIAPFSSPFYIFIGGAYSYNINKSFKYTFVRDPNNPFTSTGDFSDMYKNVFSAQVGAGYDIPLSPITSRTQVSLSPFISYHPYFGQEPRSIESWSISTVRVGVALKFGTARAKKQDVASVEENVMAPADGVSFSVNPPQSVTLRREIKETFPLRNYVFFDKGSSAIPNRYVALTKDEAFSFNEGQFQDPAPKDSIGRSKRQLSVYYNILNILGKRMNENPNAKITLIGSSAGKGSKVGKQYAASIKLYLVNVFGIDGSRIRTEGRDLPIIPSERPGGQIDVALLRDGDRRVDIVSTMPNLLTPLQIIEVQKDPLDNRIIFRVEDKSKGPLKTWSISIVDESGTVQTYGPFTNTEESISGNTILGDRANGTYHVNMFGQTKDGNEIKRVSTFHLIHNMAPKETGLRFSVLFDFDKSKAEATYEKFLTESVAPLIPENATVIIHGHTDVIGDAEYNRNLSLKRAKDARSILNHALLKTGKNNVKFQIFGFGADTNTTPFENNLPEERDYNRTVIIDIVPPPSN